MKAFSILTPLAGVASITAFVCACYFGTVNGLDDGKTVASGIATLILLVAFGLCRMFAGTKA